jgi:hypothetical protein
MDFHFDQLAPATSLAGRLAAPARRSVHRLLQPCFDRLRNLLLALSARQDADRQRIEILERRVEDLQDRLDAARPLLTDYLALTRRLGMIEDRMLRELAETGRYAEPAVGRAA